MAEHASDDAHHPWGPPMRIGKVFIKGNKRTRTEVFENELQDAYEADRIGYLVRDLEIATQELKALDIFSSIRIDLDKSSSGKKGETDITITVEEKSWRSLHLGATTDGNEEAAESSLTLSNAFGTAEKLTFGATYARSGSNTERATFQKPRFLGLPLYLSATLANELHNHEYLSSYNEKIRGGSISVSDYAGVHDLSLNVGWRDIIPRRDSKIPTAFRASPSILSEALPSTKTSIKYVFKDDSRNNVVYPTLGGLFQYSTEVSGFLGDVKFVKAEVAGQKHFSVGPILFGLPILNFSLSYHMGAVKSYGSDETRPARISDRFFLGGPMSLRGFNHKGVGPRASPRDGGVAAGDSLGGELSYNGTASVGFPCPMPLLAMLGIRGQFFANAGNLTTWGRLLDEKKWMKNLADDTRVSVGMGLVWGTRIGRLEANYSWILKSHAHPPFCAPLIPAALSYITPERALHFSQLFFFSHQKRSPRSHTKQAPRRVFKSSSLSDCDHQAAQRTACSRQSMYTGSAARIYNPRPDLAERGPPKRVTREESHIGEMVAASKKRISWKFSLGESEATHEVVLVHSVMSYKKVVEFDGRQMHYSATFTPGDWKFLMILEGSNHVFEVRINDLESASVPKYDLAVDRIPFRHWDVYRRRKQPVTTSTYALPNAQQQQQQQPSTFGTQRWGPSGMSAPPPAEPMRRPGQYSHHGGGGAQNRSPEARSNSFGTSRDSNGGHRGSFGNDRGSFGNDRGSFGNDRGSFGNASPPYPQQQQQQRRPSQSEQYGAPPLQSAQSPPALMQAKTHAPPPQKKQPEINLIDDFGPSVSVPAQALLFDPLAGSTFVGHTGVSPPQQQQQMNARTSSSPAFAPPFSAQIQPNPAPHVDPFANVPQAAPLKPTPAPIGFNQFAAPSNGYPQQQQQQQQQQQRPPQNGGMYHPTNFQQQPQMGGTPVAPMMGVQPGMANGGRMMMPVAQQQQQPVAPAMSVQPVQPVQPVRVGAPVNMNNPVNYNISQLMNPVDVNGFQQQSQQPKSINIDAFAGMKG